SSRQTGSTSKRSLMISTRAIRLVFDRAGASAVRLSIAAAMVIAKPAGSGKKLHFSSSADLCKEMSTKGNDSPAAGDLNLAGLRGESLPSDNHLLTRLKLELAYFGGQAWQSREVGGAGAILRLERVIPRRAGRFQPLKASEITPRFLDRMVRALKRWKYDFVTMDEACRRAVVLPQRRRFV